MKSKGRLLGLAMLFAAAHSFGTVDDKMNKVFARWEFNVYVDEKKVGVHVFEVTEHDGAKQIESRADFQYKVLFIPVYRYHHRNTERWIDNCLVEVTAQTDANGDRIEVYGERVGTRFRVDSGDRTTELPGCVMTFAYWNPRFLDESRLLNPQTGEYVDVDVERLSAEPLEVRGKTIMASRYRVTAYQLDLIVWYSADDRWLALESEAKGGHVIRYELS